MIIKGYERGMDLVREIGFIITPQKKSFDFMSIAIVVWIFYCLTYRLLIFGLECLVLDQIEGKSAHYYVIKVQF